MKPKKRRKIINLISLGFGIGVSIATIVKVIAYYNTHVVDLDKHTTVVGSATFSGLLFLIYGAYLFRTLVGGSILYGLQKRDGWDSYWDSMLIFKNSFLPIEIFFFLGGGFIMSGLIALIVETAGVEFLISILSIAALIGLIRFTKYLIDLSARPWREN